MTGDEPDSILDRYRRRADRFQALVTSTPPDGWGAPSPCAEWDARDVVGHLVMMHQAMLSGLGRALTNAPSVAEDPAAAFRAARADVEAALADPNLAAQPVATPMGPSTFAEHVDQVVSADLVLHGWDLARATGQDDTIDPDEVARAWPGAQQIPDIMRVPEAFGPGIVVFGPVVEVPPDAPLQDRLLGLLGRDPSYSPRPRPTDR